MKKIMLLSSMILTMVVAFAIAVAPDTVSGHPWSGLIKIYFGPEIYGTILRSDWHYNEGPEWSAVDTQTGVSEGTAIALYTNSSLSVPVDYWNHYMRAPRYAYCQGVDVPFWDPPSASNGYQWIQIGQEHFVHIARDGALPSEEVIPPGDFGRYLGTVVASEGGGCDYNGAHLHQSGGYEAWNGYTDSQHISKNGALPYWVDLADPNQWIHKIQ